MKKRGYYGIGVYHSKTEINIGTLWRSAHLYDADFIFTIGRRYKKQPADTTNAALHVPLYNYISFDDFYKNMPLGCQLVCVEQDEKSKSLPDFYHPERAIYLLGAEDYGLPKEILKSHQIIQIPTEKDFSMNVAVAGSIVMYDRYVRL